MKRLLLTATALLAFTGTAGASGLYVADPTPSFVNGYNQAPGSVPGNYSSGSFGKFMATSPALEISAPAAETSPILFDISLNTRESESHGAKVRHVETLPGLSPSVAILGDQVSRQLASIGGQAYSFDVLRSSEIWNGDADFDDFVVGVNFRPSVVPLPAAAWLFGSALFGFVMVSNRRKV